MRLMHICWPGQLATEMEWLERVLSACVTGLLHNGHTTPLVICMHVACISESAEFTVMGHTHNLIEPATGV